MNKTSPDIVTTVVVASPVAVKLYSPESSTVTLLKTKKCLSSSARILTESVRVSLTPFLNQDPE